ncbi:hypothetical protein O0L34_g7867 [Tuta absoluta]|nr:hypothetical protein O0L34_g7867 [Tuta absoluta]
MEFFEKAHVAKSTNSHRKDNKSEENVKKQLKQMLYGYRHNDNELIKNSAKEKNIIDDSSSVSGYSDLNLTNSSNEIDLIQETESGDRKEHVNQDKSLDSILEENSDQSLSFESSEISEYDEVLNSLSEEASDDKIKEMFINDSDSDSELSFIETSTDFDSQSNHESDSDFDADGVLASKIMEKLGNNKKQQTKSKKRKLEKVEEMQPTKVNLSKNKLKGPYKPKKVVSSEDSQMETLSLNMSNINLPGIKYFAGPYRPKDQTSNSSSLESLTGNSSQDDNLSQENTTQDESEDNTYSDKPPSPFVTVLAANMESQSLTDVLGEYRHPTIRNLPSDSQNTFATNNSGLFEVGNSSIVDMPSDDDDDFNENGQDEVCSLIPEIDNPPTVEEIDIDLTELDTTTVEPIEGSSFYEDTAQSEETSEREMSTDSIDPTLVNPVKVYYGKNNNCILILKHPVEIYFHGKVMVKSLGGCIEVLGYTLHDDPCEVYAPNYNYAQYIKTVENQNAYYGLFGKLTSAGLLVSEAEDIVTTLGEYDGVICMQTLKSRQMDFVENNFSATDLFSKPSKNIDNCLKKASELLGCSLYLSKPWKCFEEKPVWKQAINAGLAGDSQSRGIVCGGKGVGKSTFLRYYVNRVLRARGPVLVVDLDPGQSEFTVAGNVSATVVTEPLLGPNFTHLKQPELMLNIGMINTMDNPRRYVAAIETLVAHCNTDSRLKNLPWIVNTMGMTNTVGLKLISLIILQTQPTFLLQIDSKNVKKRYDFHLYAQTIKNLYFEDYQTDYFFANVKEVNLDYAFFLSHHTDNNMKNNFSLAPREERYLNFLAYFGGLLNMTSANLLGIVPYAVSMKDLKIGLNVKINQSAITKVINGKVVALCQSPPDNKKVFTLTSEPLRCFGTGLIRGIDWEEEVLYIITPVAAARLAAVDCLVYADWAPELRGPDTARTAAPGTPLPYRTAADYQQRQFMFAPKRRFNPLQLLKMSRKT